MPSISKLRIGLTAALIAFLLYLPSNAKANSPDNCDDAAITISVIELVDVSCFGLSNGLITVLATGGLPPYSYVWSNGAIGPLNLALSAGVYTVTCTDLLGATATLDVTVEEPDPLEVVVLSQVNIDCNNASGSITVGSQGGTGLGIYLWSNGQIGPIATNLSAGVYVVTATDDNGCISVQSITVEENLTLPAVSAAVNADINCINANVTLDGTGSALGLNIGYLWTTLDGHILSGATTLNNCVVDEPGTYVLAVTDLLNGCVASDTVVVNADINLPVVNASATAEISCINANVTLDGTGSALGVNIGYLWTTVDGHILSGATTLNNCVVDEPGTYVLAVTDLLNGCVASDTVVVNADINLPVVNASATAEISCINANVTLDGTGSALGANIGYLWTTMDGHILSGATTLNNCVVDEPGTYVLAVTDLLNGCVGLDSVIVSANLDLPTIEIAIPPQLGCQNSTVTLDATASTQGAGIIYLWTTVDGNIVVGENTLTPTVNVAGTYTLTISNSVNGCNASGSVTVGGTSDLIVSVQAVSNVDCFGGATGSATIEVSGGTTPYDYLWSNGMTSASISNLPAGSYTATVSDAGGCTGVVQITIEEPDELEVSATTTPVSGIGATDGTASLVVTGGTPPYTYLWSNGMTSANISNLAAGDYSATVTDANGCMVMIDLTVPDFTGCLLTVSLSAQNTGCGQNTGSATATISNPNGNVTYLWSNGMTTATISGLAAGDYSVTVADAAGCEALGSVTVSVEADDTPPMVITRNIVVNLDADGLAVITADMIDDGSFDLCSSVTLSIDITSFDCDDIGTHPVVLTVTDQSGNSATGSATVTVVDNIPPVFTCPDDITVNGSGIINYPLPAFKDNCFDTGNGTPVLLAGLPSGAIFPNGTTVVTYAVITTSGVTTCSFNVTVNNPLVVVVTVTPPDCPGMSNGSATATASGCTGPFNYLWMDGTGATIGTTATVDNLSAGTYTVLVANTAGDCSAMQTFTVSDPTPIDIDIIVITDECDDSRGSIAVTVSGGTPPYTFRWLDANGQVIATTQDLDNIPAGDYTLEVTDANGCVYTSGIITVDLLNATISVNQASGKVGIFPNPTADGYTNLEIDLPQESDVTASIYDLQGNLLEEVLDGYFKFQNVALNLSELPAGSYLLKVFIDGRPITRKIVRLK